MVSISGVRGIVGSSLTPEVIVRYTSAFAQYVNHDSVVVGWDGRTTGRWIESLVCATLEATGKKVIALGVVPTPTVQLAVELLRAAGGIVITASHNPIEWNGLKFVGREGLFLDENDESKVFWSIVDAPGQFYASWDKTGASRFEENFIDRHIRCVLALPYIDAEQIRRRRFRVAVDCVNASGAYAVPQLLKELGCTVYPVNCEPTGIFSHMPEPLPENLSELSETVVARGADLGIAVDPDADRLVLIMENGEPFGEEYTVTAAARFILRTLGGAGKKVVVNLSTTRAIEDVAKLFGAEVERTKVGEIHVARRMKEISAIIGGEGNGGVILPAVHYGRDSLVGIALILQELTEFGGTLSSYRRTLPEYAIVKRRLALGEVNLEHVMDHFQRSVRPSPDVRINTLDGLRIDFPGGWVHFRKSNTEPILRLIAEARTLQEANALADQITAQISDVIIGER